MNVLFCALALAFLPGVGQSGTDGSSQSVPQQSRMERALHRLRSLAASPSWNGRGDVEEIAAAIRQVCSNGPESTQAERNMAAPFLEESGARSPDEIASMVAQTIIAIPVPKFIS